MKFRILLIALMILAGGMLLQKQQTVAAAPQPSAEEEAAILASTVQIAMYEYALEEGGAEPGSRGLGTLVDYGGKQVIVTHDHWEHLTPNLHEVELRDAAGQLLLTLDAMHFRALIRYRDGGTMLLQAPDGLAGIAAAALSAPPAVDDTVTFARRSPQSGRTALEGVVARVTDVESGSGPARLKLRSADGSTVIPGDSGGGVWVNGRLAGNMWAAGVKEQRFFWSDWFGGSSREASDLAIAALQPFSGQSIAVGDTDATQDATGSDVPQGLQTMEKDEALEAMLLDR